MTVGTLVIYRGKELPTRDLWWHDSTGIPVDFTVGWTMPSSVTFRQAGVDTSVTAVVTPNASPSGDGSQAAHVASLNFAPALDSLDAVPLGPGHVVVTVIHTATGKNRTEEWPLLVKA